MRRICVECEREFDPFSAAKANVGGRIDTCHHCSEEDTVPYLGLTSGDGKGVGITILAFNTRSDRYKYAQAWADNSGANKGKVCQMSRNAPIMSGMKFRKVHEAGLGMNHKGKM
jgi:hypothetical protein